MNGDDHRVPIELHKAQPQHQVTEVPWSFSWTHEGCGGTVSAEGVVEDRLQGVPCNRCGATFTVEREWQSPTVANGRAVREDPLDFDIACEECGRWHAYRAKCDPRAVEQMRADAAEDGS